MKTDEEYEKLYFEHQAQGFRLRDALEELARIKPTYERLYRNPFFWFIRPNDPHLTGQVLFRCKTCGKLFWKNGKAEFASHLGHVYTVAQDTTVWEWLKIKLGMIR